MSRFVLKDELQREDYDWGDLRFRCNPPLTGAKHFTVMDVALGPGGAHAFHTHPDQEEMIIVTSGHIEQWIEREKQTLGPGDSVYIDAGAVHATYNDGSEVAQLQVVVGPCVGEVGYEVVDVSGEQPWSGLRGG
jgi:quercetin dioxygenase-like cupin family protein